MRNLLLFYLGVLAAGCGTDSETQYVTNFHPPSAQAGYTRFVTPIMKGFAPGQNIEICQWIAAPAAQAMDVVDVTGSQSPTGHHALLYATTETQFPVGETHECTEQDMLTSSFVAGIGGEGTAMSGARLPDGLFFRVPANQALMINTHWVNATDEMVDGQAVIDVKFEPASPERETVDLFSVDGTQFAAIPGATTFDTTCVLDSDLSIAMIANHMHEHGASAFTELIHADGSKEMLVADPAWQIEEQFNARFTVYSRPAPKLARAGDTIHTHCEWANTTTKTLTFPSEMCIGFGFYFPGRGQRICVNGAWRSPQ